jgi:hypothetical protein
MKSNKIKTVLTWLPSIPIIIFFVQNAFDKIFYSNQLDKLVANSTVLILTGIVLLIATALFLFERTIIVGTAILATYMTIVTFVHISKEKPFFMTILIVLLTIIAGYVRRTKLITQKRNGSQHNA